MKNIFKALFLCAFLVTGCGDDDEGGSTDGGGPEVVEATYRLTITTNFTEETHPTDFPAGASFGPVVGFAHSANTGIFSLGALATDPFAEYIETSNANVLVNALTPADDGNNNDVSGNIVAGGELGPAATTSVVVTVTQSAGRISFVAKLEPSPDWFVGVDSFNILGADNLLIEDETVELLPLDAGIDAGATFLSEADPNSETIKAINSEPFTDGMPLSTVTPLGTLRIERIN